MRGLIYRWLYDIAYPNFDCEDCIGMFEYGCQCAYYGASAPGIGPERWRRWLQNWINRR